MKIFLVCFAAACVVAVALASFTYYSAPYSIPVVETPSAQDTGSFDGLLDLAESLPPSGKVKVLWTHGMCTHPPGWADDRVKRLAEAVGGTVKSVSARTVGGHGAVLRIERISTPKTTIEAMFLTWSPLTASYKAALAQDRSAMDGRVISLVRATLNSELKGGLVNDCLTDVVVYGGPNGNNIRQAVNESVCEALGGRYSNLDCVIQPNAAPEALALVTESLGSKLVFDSVLHLWNAAQNNPDRAAIDRLSRSLAAARVMYMLSNQVPLLDTAGSVAMDKTLEPGSVSSPARTQTSAGDVFGLLSRARSQTLPASAPMTVVAFSDPNDLLSYRIVPEHLTEDLREFRVINVLVSNDDTYFGYMERPDTAHCGYPWNPYVFGMLARGYQAGKPLHSVARQGPVVCPHYIWTPGAVADPVPVAKK